jgi:hypothetical protein
MPDGAPACRGGTLVSCLAATMELAHRWAPPEPPAMAASPYQGCDGALSSVRIESSPPSASGLGEGPCATGAEPQGPERGGQSEGGGRIRPRQRILRRRSRGAGLARDGYSRPRRRVRNCQIWGWAAGGRSLPHAGADTARRSRGSVCGSVSLEVAHRRKERRKKRIIIFITSGS